MRAVELTSVLAASIALALPATAAAGTSAPEAFPKDFMWGTASSGFQTEMGAGSAYSDKGSDWWKWVRDPANISSKKVSGDLPEKGPGGWKTSFSGDIALTKGLGMNTWRMGFEWSRIFPKATASVAVGPTITATNLKALDKLADAKAVAKYRVILKSARSKGLRPFVTLNHFTLPLWAHDPIAVRDALSGRGPDAPLPTNLTSKSGWLSATTVQEFRKYAAYAAWKFGDLVDWWSPVNEPMVVAVSGFVNVPGAYANWFPPGVFSYTAAAKAIENLAAANSVAYSAVHSFDSKDSDGDGKKAQVGLVQNMIHFTPANPLSATDVASTDHADRIFNRLLPDAAINGQLDRNANGVADPGEYDPAERNKADFFGVNYYFRGRVTGVGTSLSSTIPLLDFLPKTGYRWALNPTADVCPTTCSQFGSEIDVDGFGAVLREAAGYGKPLIVTENGIADSGDSQRTEFLVRHLDQAWRVAGEKPGGVPLLGWFHWSLTDNYEWTAGYTPKFGLYSYSAKTLKRTARPAAAVVKTIAKANAIPGEVIDRWINTAPNS